MTASPCLSLPDARLAFDAWARALDAPVRWERTAGVDDEDPVTSEHPRSMVAGRDADTLDAIRADLGDCQRCRLCRNRRRLVFGAGARDADLLVMGQAPGPEEDLEGTPFVGPCGEMLDRMLVNVFRLPRSSVYVLNGAMCMPPLDRMPERDELEACRPWWERQIEVVRPKVILAMGRVAANLLSGTDVGIRQLRGRWTSWRGIPVMPTFHPSYLLRHRGDALDDKRYVASDLAMARARYDELRGRRPATQPDPLPVRRSGR